MLEVVKSKHFFKFAKEGGSFLQFETVATDTHTIESKLPTVMKTRTGLSGSHFNTVFNRKQI